MPKKIIMPNVNEAFELQKIKVTKSSLFNSVLQDYRGRIKQVCLIITCRGIDHTVYLLYAKNLGTGNYLSLEQYKTDRVRMYYIYL